MVKQCSIIETYARNKIKSVFRSRTHKKGNGKYETEGEKMHINTEIETRLVANPIID